MTWTILGVPFLMTVLAFTGTLMSRSSARVRQEASLLCLCDKAGDDIDHDVNLGPQFSAKRSPFHRRPASKWNSMKTKRLQRTQSCQENDPANRTLHFREDLTR